MATALAVWAEVIEREYLAEFIPADGGALRMVVADPQVLEGAAGALRQAATRNGLASLAIDCAEIKLQQVQHLFFATARAIDWPALLQRRMEMLVADAGYRWPEPGRRLGLPALAEAAGVQPHQLRAQISREMNRSIWGATRMVQDFRYAMMALLEARLEPEEDPLEAAVMAWLTGELGRVSAVRKANIGAKVNRHSARAMLISLCHWLRACGGPGVLVLLDIRRLLRDRREVAEGVVYTPAAVMDCYEVLRQVIDDSEHFEGAFFVVLADDVLLADDSRRGLDRYAALRMRVQDDVRPSEGDNPLAPLVVLQ